jgi:hypothetical protein
MYSRFTELSTAYATATQKIQNLRVAGETIRLRRETLRQRAAAVINGYRTKDLSFRTFRNEALVQYRTLFDLAGRYSYLAAKSYDYETGLLGTPQGQAVINRLVASRSLGDLTGGEPQATTSTLGDAGLAGTMAQLNADFAVAEGRLRSCSGCCRMSKTKRFPPMRHGSRPSSNTSCPMSCRIPKSPPTAVA